MCEPFPGAKRAPFLPRIRISSAGFIGAQHIC
jgi:hypothetical protein